jgi:hypothetical protein
MPVRTIVTPQQPYFTSNGEKLYLGTSTEVEVDSNGKYIPDSAKISLRLYTGTGFLGTDYKTVAIRQPGQPWIPTQDGNQNYVAGVDLRQTLANKNSLMNINLNNHVSNALQAPLQGVPAGQVNTNRQSSANAALGLPPTAGNARPDPPAPDPAIIPDPEPISTKDGSVPVDAEFLNLKPLEGSAKDIEYGTLYYPLNRRNTEDYDYLKVTVIKFLETGLRTDAKSFNVISTEKRGVKPLGRVFLPMQPGISDTNGVSWNEDRLNPFQAALGGVAASAITTLGDGKVVAGAQGLFQGLINTGQNIANDPNMQNYVSAYFAGQAVGANLVARTTGAVLNNNLELLFNGPKLRSFRYNFRFTPRDEPESAMIKKIIRMFKREMAASRSDTGLFLITPNVFELEYMTSNNEPHPFLNKIKRCALSDISVNYTPDGTYMTYQDRSMTSYEVQLQFSELEPIYKEDYDDAKGKEGMGY